MRVGKRKSLGKSPDILSFIFGIDANQDCPPLAPAPLLLFLDKEELPSIVRISNSLNRFHINNRVCA